MGWKVPFHFFLLQFTFSSLWYPKLVIWVYMYRTPEIFYVYTKKYVHAVFYSLLFLHKWQHTIPLPFFFSISLVVWFRELSILVHKHFLILLHGHKVLVLWTQHNLRLLLMEFLLFPILHKRPTLLCPQWCNE